MCMGVGIRIWGSLLEPELNGGSECVCVCVCG